MMMTICITLVPQFATPAPLNLKQDYHKEDTLMSWLYHCYVTIYCIQIKTIITLISLTFVNDVLQHMLGRQCQTITNRL